MRFNAEREEKNIVTLTSGVPIERVKVSTYRVPTDSHESDGTLEWASTTLVLVDGWLNNRKRWA